MQESKFILIFVAAHKNIVCVLTYVLQTLPKITVPSAFLYQAGSSMLCLIIQNFTCKFTLHHF